MIAPKRKSQLGYLINTYIFDLANVDTLLLFKYVLGLKLQSRLCENYVQTFAFLHNSDSYSNQHFLP